ncbi:S8 family peptidase [Candidatus Woesearchaeota archaeon]|nr:S8 family peptidase [Candidatus Woesearchaeota archaeon]
MKRNILVMISLFLVLLFAVFGFAQNDKVRVIAHTDKELSDAFEKGCKKIREARGLKALECTAQGAASLGLQDDVRIFAVDIGVNRQIGADIVHVSGNNGSGRRVAVLDTGYNYNHPELVSSYLGGVDFVNDDQDPYDDNGHGTHVAGIITADGYSSRAKGVAPGTGIIAGKVLDSSGAGYFSDLVAAIYWVVDGPDGVANTSDDFGVDAISISIGTSRPYTYSGFCDSVLPDLTNAVRYARDRGVIVVVAAGNSGSSGVSIPGCISYSTTVGAVDGRDKVARFSGRGSSVDLAAPGVKIYSTWLGSTYASASGTSMATPAVSGAVALIKLAHPEFSVAQVEQALFSSSRDLGKAGKDTLYGWGRVNVTRAVN